MKLHPVIKSIRRVQAGDISDHVIDRTCLRLSKVYIPNFSRQDGRGLKAWAIALKIAAIILRHRLSYFSDIYALQRLLVINSSVLESIAFNSATIPVLG